MGKIPPGVGPKHPQVVVLVGATGDLSRRKLLPRLFHLSRAGFIPGCRIVGVSLDDLDPDAFRIAVREALAEFSSRKVPEADWAAFAETLDYVPLAAGAGVLRAAVEKAERTQVTTLIGGPRSHLARVRWRRATTGEETELPICHLFLFVGVEPATAWLRDCGIELDPEGFVRTGSEDHRPRPLPLESSIPGVFAVGDVRAGSAKRVGGAIGEGAAVVAQLHTVLADAPAPTPRTGAHPPGP